MRMHLGLTRRNLRALYPGVIAAALVAAACAPAAQPSPTAAPAQPAPTTAAPKAESKPAATAAPAKPAATTAPAKTEAQPAASPAAKAAEKAAPKAEAKPVAKVDTQAVAGFYQGKTIRIVVGSAPGGGYDTYARVISRHMPKHIPGNPNMIVENMEGAGSLRAANHVYNAADKDGTIIGSIQGGLFVQQLLGLPGIEFEATKFQFLGFPTGETPTCVATAQSGINSLEEVQNPNGKEFIVGGNAPGSSTWDTPMRLRAALDLNIRVVEGYSGTAPVRLAMDQGEVDGMCGWGWESLQATGLDKVQAGEYKIIAQIAEEPIDHPAMQGVPLAQDLTEDPEAKQLIRLGTIVPGQILRPYLVAPEVPADRAQALREAFAATMEDPEFLADAQQAKLEIAPIAGARGQQLVADLFTMPESIKEKLKAINERRL